MSKPNPAVVQLCNCKSRSFLKTRNDSSACKQLVIRKMTSFLNVQKQVCMDMSHDVTIECQLELTMCSACSQSQQR